MELFRDVRYGLRQLWRAPGFTAAAVLALGLGVGATTAIFSVLDAVVLRPLPYAQPERLVTLREANAKKGLEREPMSPVNFVDYRALNRVFSDAAAWWRPTLTLTGEGQEPLRVRAIETSSNLFAVLGVRPRLGAGFPETGPIHKPNIYEVVISDRLWRSRFNANPAIVGQSIRLDNVAHTVLGVMPPGFHFPENDDIWVRLGWDLARHSRAAHFMDGVARLRDGVTIEGAQAELTALSARLGKEFANSNRDWIARATPLHVEVIGFFRPALYVLLGAVSLLLVIACVNVASLMLARSTVREREVAIRAAIGATRTRLVRQFLTESALLAMFGSLAGVLLAFAGVRLLVTATPVPIPRLDEVGLDARVLVFALGVAAATAIGFGLLPALFLSGVDSQQTLKESTRTTTSRRREHTRRLLVVAEIGFAVMLLFGAGLLIRTVSNLARQDPGFARAAAAASGARPTTVLTASVQLTRSTYPQWAQVAQFYGTLLDRLRQSSEVEFVGASNTLPLESSWRMPYRVRGRVDGAGQGEAPLAQYQTVSDGYFESLGVPLMAGRTFDAHDTPNSEGVVVINQTLARQQFGRENPVGQTITSMSLGVGPLGSSLMKERAHRIIGVVGDVKNHSLQSPAEPALYHTVRQFPFMVMHVAVRGPADASRLTALLREAVRATDPAIALSDIQTIDAVVDSAVSQLRLLTYLMAGFAALALLLAIVGIYGMLAYAVSQRQQEISIRLALGASRAGVLWLVLRQGLVLAVTGAALGAAGGIVLSRSMSGLLYGVRASDTLTLAAVTAIVVCVALVACLIPARRAATVEPLAGLRGE
jgi:putative ABC transport system permease protein